MPGYSCNTDGGMIKLETSLSVVCDTRDTKHNLMSVQFVC